MLPRHVPAAGFTHGAPGRRVGHRRVPRANPFPQAARNVRFIPNIVARLKPGVSLDQAQAQLSVFSDSLRRDFVGDYPAASGWSLTMTPLKDVVVGHSRTLLISLLLAVGLILLIACVNVANILLAESSARQREISIRLAMGATRGRIVRQLLTESAILSAGAAIAGTLASTASLRFLVGLLPSQLPHVNAISVDGRVLAFSLAVALITTGLFGLMPAAQAAKKEREGAQLWGRSASALSARNAVGKGTGRCRGRIVSHAAGGSRPAA